MSPRPTRGEHLLSGFRIQLLDIAAVVVGTGFRLVRRCDVAWNTAREGVEHLTRGIVEESERGGYTLAVGSDALRMVSGNEP
jgi:hypothetical protein